MKHLSLFLLAVLVLASCSPPAPQTANQPASAPPSSQTGSVTQSSPAYAKLAAIEAKSPNPPAELIAAFKAALDSVSKKCPQDSPDRISDYIVSAQKLLKEKGVELKLSAIALHIDQSIPAGGQIAQCSEVVAAFVTMTSK